MTTLIRATMALLIVAAWQVGCTAQQDTATMQARAQAQPEQQEEFIPIDELPPQEQYPVLPLLVGAYAFVLLMLFAYLVSVSRRLTAIQREVDRLESEMGQPKSSAR